MWILLLLLVIFVIFAFIILLLSLIPLKIFNEKINVLFNSLIIQKIPLYYITRIIGFSLIFAVVISLSDFNYGYFIKYILLFFFSYISVFLIVYYWFEYKEYRKRLCWHFILSFLAASIIWVTISHDSYYDGMEREIVVQNKIINNIIKENINNENLSLILNSLFKKLPSKHWLIVKEQTSDNKQNIIFSTKKNISTLQKNKYLWYWDEDYYDDYNEHHDKSEKIGNYVIEYGAKYRPGWFVALIRSISFSLSDIIDSKNPNSIQNVKNLVKTKNLYFIYFLFGNSGKDHLLGVGKHGNWERSWNFYVVFVLMLLIIPRFLVEMRKIQREKKELSESTKLLKEYVNTLNKKVEDRDNIIKKKNIRINLLNDYINDKEDEINKSKEELQKLNDNISIQDQEIEKKEAKLVKNIKTLSKELERKKEEIKIERKEKERKENEKKILKETIKNLQENNDDIKKIENKRTEYKEIFDKALETPILYQLAFSEYCYDKYKNVREFSSIIMLGMSTAFEHLLRKIMLGNRYWLDQKTSRKDENKVSQLINKYELRYLLDKDTDIIERFKQAAYIRNDVSHYKEDIFTPDNVMRYRHMLFGDNETKDGVLFVLLNTYKEEEKKNKNNKK